MKTLALTIFILVVTPSLGYTAEPTPCHNGKCGLWQQYLKQEPSKPIEKSIIIAKTALSYPCKVIQNTYRAPKKCCCTRYRRKRCR